MSSYFDNQDEKDNYIGDDNSDNDTNSINDSDNEFSDNDLEEDNNDNMNVSDDENDIEQDYDEDDDEEEEDDEDDEDDEQMGGNKILDIEEGEIYEAPNKSKRVKKVPTKTVYKKPENYDDDDDDDDGEQYLQKFEQSINKNYIANYHPESVLQNYDEILSMTKVVRNADGIIIDKLHRTIPYLTKYEKARILGQRAKQINSGAYPFIKVPENVIDGYIIAELELKQKRIPFIIRRPLPNGGSEYWKLQDLEDISF